jgi:predicted ATPase
MELVYLWVEKYKNIEKQGFNFSPRFECSYDGENLTIDKNDDYVSIFPDNINITAIIGENGSGKSSIIKLIFMLIFFKKFESTNDKTIFIQLRNLIEHYGNKELFLIVRHDEKFKKISFLEMVPKNKYIHISNYDHCKIEKYDSLDSKEIDFYDIHFNYMLDTLSDNEVSDGWIKKIYHKADDYTMPLLLEPFKNNFDKQIINLDTIQYLTNQKILRFYSEFENIKILSFFNPNKIKYTINKDKICRKIIEHQNRIFSKKDDYQELEENKILVKIEELIKNKDFESLNNIYFFTKTSEEYPLLPNNPKLTNDNFIAEINNFIKKDKYEKTAKDTIMSWLSIEEYIPYQYIKLENSINFKLNIIDKNKIDMFNNDKDKILTLKDNEELLNNLPPWVDIHFYEDNISTESLSSGEKSLFVLLINLMYQVKNVTERKEYNTINLFLDETELGLHPNWQKKYLSEILDALKLITKKQINIFFATHSPFLLSDLPKENVIFLEKYNKEDPEVMNKKQKIGNCKNSTKEVNINPFGANIHTLLSHGFFMKDGLMGEFAKGKITKILNFLNGKNKFIDLEVSIKIPFVLQNNFFDKNLKPIIKMIGEDFLREKLLKMYDERFPISKKEKIKQLEEELKRLKNA